MTTLEQLRTDRRTDQGTTGQPVLFGAMLAVAALTVLALLVIGPSLPLVATVGMAAGALVLVLAAWLVAGPRW